MPDFQQSAVESASCRSIIELDHYWDRLSAGGDEKAQQCGWLKDRFGVSWQVVPSLLSQMLQDPDTRKTERVMTALLQMQKLEINKLERAYGNG